MNEFFTWAMLGTYAGITACVAMITQVFKDVGILKKLPTRIFSYIVAVIVLLVSTVFTDGLTWSSGVLCLVNAVVVSLAANGTFDAMQIKE